MSETLHFTTGDGCDIAYRIDGPADAPVLLLSNSIATTLHMWDRSIPELSRAFRVLAYDFRGHGASDAPAGAYSLDRLGRDVLELFDHLGIARAHVLGLSLGGFVAQWLAIFAPERVDRLILSNTSPKLAAELPFNDMIRGVLAAPDLEAVAEGFVHNWFPAAMFERADPLLEEFRNEVRATSPLGLAGCYAALRDVDLTPIVRLVAAPTLVIGGRQDGVTRPEHSQAIAAAIPGAKLVLLDGVHMLNVERPEQFHTAVREFLAA